MANNCLILHRSLAQNGKKVAINGSAVIRQAKDKKRAPGCHGMVHQPKEEEKVVKDVCIDAAGSSSIVRQRGDSPASLHEDVQKAWSQSSDGSDKSALKCNEEDVGHDCEN